MKEELKQLIEKNLPAMAAGEMSKFIEQAEKDKIELNNTKKQLNEVIEANKNFQKDLQKLRSNEEEVAGLSLKLKAKEKDLENKEINLKVSELEYKLKAEEKSKLDIFNLVNTFVANPRAIEIISKTTNYNHEQYWEGNHNSHKTLFSVENGEIEKKETKK